VGGGYLGDKYLRESLLTLLFYRAAQALGLAVETMPISISSASGRLLRLAFRFAGRGVDWRSRESTTHRILQTLNLTSSQVPDLAWLDSLAPLPARNRSGIVIAPVGSSFYVEDDGREPKLWPAIRELLRDLEPGEPIRFVAMHRWVPRLDDGRDDAACRTLLERVQSDRPDLDVRLEDPKSYEEVRALMNSSRFAICERLHAALAAITTDTPAVVIGYEPKHVGVLMAGGLEGMCSPDAAAAVGAYAPREIGEKARAQAHLVNLAIGGLSDANTAR
jgi:polysaccharide pyruvyl transferase WcaK-like protein